MNLKYWPFDTQICALQFGSWTYHGEQIDLQMIDNNTAIQSELLNSNSEWEVIDVKSARNSRYYACCAEPYPDITITLTLKRRAPSYKALIITPAFGKF